MFLSTVFLIGFSISGSYAYELINPTTNILEQGTIISNISLSEQSVEEAKALLVETTDTWKETNSVSFQYKDREATTSAAMFYHFRIDESIELAKKQKQLPIVVQLDELSINHAINELANEDILFKIDREQLDRDLISYATSLTREDFQINLHDYIFEHLKEEVVIADGELADLSHGSYFYLNQIVESLDGYIIEPNETVSLLSILNEQSLNSSHNELSMVSSIFYKALTETNFEIIERYISQSLPPYSQLGFEAFVSYPNHDLRFVNPNYTPYTITAKIELDELYVSINGEPLDYRYETKLLEEQTFSPKTIIHYSEELRPGTSKVALVGQEGRAAMVMKEEYTREGSLVRTVQLSEDFYRPVHHIEVRSLNQLAIPPVEGGIPNPDSSEDEYDGYEDIYQDEEEYDEHEVENIKGY